MMLGKCYNLMILKMGNICRVWGWCYLLETAMVNMYFEGGMTTTWGNSTDILLNWINFNRMVAFGCWHETTPNFCYESGVHVTSHSVFDGAMDCGSATLVEMNVNHWILAFSGFFIDQMSGWGWDTDGNFLIVFLHSFRFGSLCFHSFQDAINVWSMIFLIFMLINIQMFIL